MSLRPVAFLCDFVLWTVHLGIFIPELSPAQPPFSFLLRSFVLESLGFLLPHLNPMDHGPWAHTCGSGVLSSALYSDFSKPLLPILDSGVTPDAS